GRYYWSKRTEQGVKKGLAYFQQAIEIDPGYALAYAGVADSYNILGFYGVLPPREAFPKAKAAALKALEIDDTITESHTSLAYARFYHDWDWGEAGREFQRAFELNATYATARHFYGNYLVAMGRIEEGLAEFERAQRLDPLALIINAGIGWALYFARRYDEAIEQCRKTLEMEPTFVPAHLFLAQACVQKHIYGEAIAEFQKALTLSENNTEVVAVLGHAYAVAGRKGDALKLLDELQQRSQRSYVSSYGLALLHTGLGRHEQACACLEKAYDERAHFMAMLKVEPRFDPLRSDPRFQDLLRRMNFPEN
ncbi:tetratricopeptide repeat protein, partial [Acidobacteriia bacterium AH_259_A11_L15]|nr:tetratricopeptide repeat protein [Acidobacteriia bacterium AH_259_A11_L15]